MNAWAARVVEWQTRQTYALLIILANCVSNCTAMDWPTTNHKTRDCCGPFWPPERPRSIQNSIQSKKTQSLQWFCEAKNGPQNV